MCLFVALEIDPTVRDALARIVVPLTSESPGARWSKPEATHVTLKFLGETEAQKVESIRAILAKIVSPQPIMLRFRGIGFFPDEKRPRGMWWGVVTPPTVLKGATRLEPALTLSGFE